MTRRFLKEQNYLKEYLYDYPIDGIEFAYDFYSRVVHLWVHFENKFPNYVWLYMGYLDLKVKPGSIQDLLDRYYSTSVNSYLTKNVSIYSYTSGDHYYYLELKNPNIKSFKEFIDDSIIESFADKIKSELISKENSKKDSICHFIIPLHEWPERNREKLFELLKKKNNDFEVLRPARILAIPTDLEEIKQVDEDADNLFTYAALCYLFSKSLYLILNDSEFTPTPRNPKSVLSNLNATKEKVEDLEKEYEISKLYWESKNL